MSPSTSPLGAAHKRERGQILVLFAFILIGLLLVSALAVDYGGWLLARRTYQNVADAAALAGASQLTNAVGAACTVAQPSKNHCAREAAWTSVKNALSLTALTPALQANQIGNVAYVEAGYQIWVASPPSDAGAAYTGLASSTKTIFVRVERDLQAGLSRIIKTSTRVGSWATAGRIPENFAIIVLCQTGCLAGGSDLQVAGANSNLILESGDLASNSFGHTGNNSAIALCQGSVAASQCSAYMHTASECQAGDVNCQLVAWTGTAVDDTTQYSALALPQVIDPQYQAPTLNSTTAPYQCYSTSDTPPNISAISEPFAEGPTLNGLPIHLASAIKPQPTSVVQLASSTMGGQVIDSVSTAPLNGATVTVVGPNGSLTPTTYTATTATVGNKVGTYSIPSVTPSGQYTMTVTLANYGTQQFNIDVSANGPTNRDVALVPNPGTISGTVSGTVASSMTISTNNGSSTTISSTGPYTLTNVTPGSTIIVTPTPPNGYQSTPLSRTVSVTPAQNVTGVDFVISAVPTGTVTGTVTDDTTGLAIPGVTVTITQGAGSGKSGVTNSSGAYTINSVTTGSNQKVTASLAGYTNATSGTFTVTAGVTTTVPTLKMWPANCGTNNPPSGGKSGNYKGDWECDPSKTCTPSVTGAGGDISCSSFDTRNRIRPGTYYDITIDNGGCGWIDPLGGAPGVTAGQKPGIVYVTNHLSIGSNAYLFGDGVTIVLGPDAYVDVGNSGGFVIDYQASTGTFANTWRTLKYIGGGTGATQVFTTCATDTDGTSSLSKGAITTGGAAHVVRYTWDTSGATPCYQDGDQGSYTTTNSGEIGITWYLKGTPSKSNRFSMSSQMGFLFDGVLYGPKDDVQLGGSSGQAAAGQIVAWTLKYNGSTDIHQRYTGLEVDGPPYLIEPYLGE